MSNKNISVLQDIYGGGSRGTEMRINQFNLSFLALIDRILFE